MGRHGIDCSGSGLGEVTRSCEFIHVSTGSIHCGVILTS
jgi:hypothetical protein